jgi:hypothetical protein
MSAAKSREVICGNRIKATKARAEDARKRAVEAAPEADRAEALAWSVRMDGYGGPAQPSPTIAQCLNGGFGRLVSKVPSVRGQGQHPALCHQTLRTTPISKLEASLKCPSCRKGRNAPPVRMIKVTEQREITPYRRVHPDQER